MQLKEKLNLKNIELQGVNPFKLLVSVVFSILKFSVITVVFVALLYGVNYTGIKTTPALMSMVYAVMLVASLISCTFGLTKAMYFSNDNAILLTLPCKPIQVYLSKLIIFFAYELKRNLMFVTPLFFAYFIMRGYPIGAYFWAILCFAMVSLFTVAISSILSIPFMWISSIFRQRRALQIGTLVCIVSAVVVVLFYVVSLIPETLDLRATWRITINQVFNFTTNFSQKFSFYYDLTRVFLGNLSNGTDIVYNIGATAANFFIVVGMTTGLFALGLLIALPLFYKMASTPFEYLKKAVDAKKNHVTGKYITTFYTEFISSIKNSSRTFTNVGIMLSVPFLIYLLNKIFYAMNTTELGESLVAGFNVMIILLVVLNANTSAASIYSRDGRAAYLIKTQPTNPAIILFSKLLPDAMFCIISLIATFVVLTISSKMGILNALFLMLGIMFIYFAHLMYCAELDIMNPQHEIYATVGAADNNPNETSSTLSAFIVSFLTAGVVILLLIDTSAGIRVINFSETLSLSTVYLKLFLVSLGYAVYRVFLYFSNIKLYYKEK